MCPSVLVPCFLTLNEVDARTARTRSHCRLERVHCLRVTIVRVIRRRVNVDDGLMTLVVRAAFRRRLALSVTNEVR